MKLFSKKQKSLLGISFSTHTIRIVEIIHDRNGYYLNNFVIHDLMPDEIDDDTIVDCENLGHTLAKYINHLNIEPTHVATAIADSSAIVKLIDLPAGLTDIELEAEIMVDADQYIPYPLAEVSFDFEVIGPSPNDNQAVQVLLVASLTESINQRVDALAFGGLEASVIELESHSIERAFQLISDSLPGYPETVLLVDIGHTRTTFYIAKEGVFLYTLDQLFGGYDLTAAIQANYGLNFDEATQVKHHISLTDTNPSYVSYASEVFQPFIKKLTEYIKQALQQYAHSREGDEIAGVEHLVEHLVLFGGSTKLDSLSSMLENQLEIPVSVGNPFCHMALHSTIDRQLLNEEASGLMAACGLALRNDSHEIFD